MATVVSNGDGNFFIRTFPLAAQVDLHLPYLLLKNSDAVIEESNFCSLSPPRRGGSLGSQAHKVRDCARGHRCLPPSRFVPAETFSADSATLSDGARRTFAASPPTRVHSALPTSKIKCLYYAYTVFLISPEANGFFQRFSFRKCHALSMHLYVLLHKNSAATGTFY